ncbi:hypothetical protein [Nocardioides sp. SYSU DS0663]|uniref:hypothetical protein n=1 Tax=Nocardioides sp. SYSU DS0663 TaxID=3416445 RepID=UPI003F4C41A3
MDFSEHVAARRARSPRWPTLVAAAGVLLALGLAAASTLSRSTDPAPDPAPPTGSLVELVTTLPTLPAATGPAASSSAFCVPRYGEELVHDLLDLARSCDGGPAFAPEVELWVDGELVRIEVPTDGTSLVCHEVHVFRDEAGRVDVVMTSETQLPANPDETGQ